MKPKTFRALERFNIHYDIKIDEEEYNIDSLLIRVGGIKQDDAILRAIGGESAKEIHAHSFKKIGLSAKDITNLPIEIDADDTVGKHWFNLFIAKRVRALLQKKGIPEGSLNEVALYLLANLPPKELKDPSIIDSLSASDRWEYEQNKTLFLLFLNEISACYKEDLSIGYARQALAFISEVASIEKTKPTGTIIYELLALFNCGRGYQHLHHSELAIQYLDQVIGRDWVNNIGRDWANNYVDEKFGCGRIEKIDKELWNRYVHLPATMVKAETLLDLNRSAEVVKLLLGEEYDSVYLQMESLRLVARAKIDGEHWTPNNEQDMGTFEIQEAEKLAGDHENIKNKLALLERIEVVNFSYKIEKFYKKMARCQYLAENGKAGSISIEPEKMLQEIRRSLDSADKQAKVISAKENEDSEEKGQSLLLWIEFLELLFVRLPKLKNASEGRSIEWLEECQDRWNKLFDQIDGYVTNDPDRKTAMIEKLQEIYNTYFRVMRWMPDQVKNTERYLEILREINDREEYRNERTVDIESKVLRKLTESEDAHGFEWQYERYLGRICQLEKSHPLGVNGKADVQKIIKLSSKLFCDDKKCNVIEKFSGCDESKTSCMAGSFNRTLNRNFEHFKKQLISTTLRGKNTYEKYCVTALRRWQSFTPVLSSGKESDSKGGGYFVYLVDKKGAIEQGVAVDPGFDFIENFLSAGFSIEDITAVIMSHAHIDHTADFQPIISLTAEVRKLHPEKKLLAIMSEGCFKNFQQIIDNSREIFSDVVVLNTRSNGGDNLLRHPALDRFQIQPLPAYHNDFTKKDAMGIGILSDESRELMAFTGDTRWHPNMTEQFNNYKLVFVNMGGIYKQDRERGKNTLVQVLGEEEQIIKQMMKKDHLYLPGYLLLTSSWKNKTIVISEIPEEFTGGIKIELSKALNNLARNKNNDLIAIPEDIGLTFIFDKINPLIQCFSCNALVEPEDLGDPVPFGKNEATFYVCKGCEKYRGKTILENKIKGSYESKRQAFY